MNRLIDRLPRFLVFLVILPIFLIEFLLSERHPLLQHQLPWMDVFPFCAKVVLSKEVGVCTGRRHRRRRSGMHYLFLMSAGVSIGWFIS